MGASETCPSLEQTSRSRSIALRSRLIYTRRCRSRTPQVGGVGAAGRIWIRPGWPFRVVSQPDRLVCSLAAALSPRSRLVAPVGRQVGLGLAQDVEDGLAVGLGEVVEVAGVVAAGEDGVEAF